MKDLSSVIRKEEWTPEDKQKLMEAIDKAREEWLMAQNLINEMEVPVLIDYSIYLYKAAEAKYTYLIKLGKELGMHRDYIPEPATSPARKEG